MKATIEINGDTKVVEVDASSIAGTHIVNEFKYQVNKIIKCMVTDRIFKPTKLSDLDDFPKTKGVTIDNLARHTSIEKLEKRVEALEKDVEFMLGFKFRDETKTE